MSCFVRQECAKYTRGFNKQCARQWPREKLKFIYIRVVWRSRVTLVCLLRLVTSVARLLRKAERSCV